MQLGALVLVDAIEPADEDLGFKAEVTLDEGLRRLVAWRQGELRQIEQEVAVR